MVCPYDTNSQHSICLHSDHILTFLEQNNNNLTYKKMNDIGKIEQLTTTPFSDRIFGMNKEFADQKVRAEQNRIIEIIKKHKTKGYKADWFDDLIKSIKEGTK